MKDASRGADYEKISPLEAKKIINSDKVKIIIDVRGEDDYKLGHIKDAISLPLEEIEVKCLSVISDKNSIILVYCARGIRSEFACRKLIELGYSYVYDMGGILYWPYEIVI